MIDLAQLTPVVERLTEGWDGPLVLYSSAWQLVALAKMPPKAGCEAILQAFLDASAGRGLLLPTFTPGFKEGALDLDTAPSTTGLLTEIYRQLPGSRRTVCPFFSFAVQGPDTEELVALRPADAWGEGSLYEWLHRRNGIILNLGLHPTHCSFTHYLEWLHRDRVRYRFQKEFRGQLTHEGQTWTHECRAFVRYLEPHVPNTDFQRVLPALEKNGLRTAEFAGVALSAIPCQAKVDAISPLLEADPHYFLVNRDDFPNP